MQVMNINALGGTLLLGVFLQKDTREKSEIEIKNLGQPAEVHTSKAAFTPWLPCTLSREAEPLHCSGCQQYRKNNSNLEMIESCFFQARVIALILFSILTSISSRLGEGHIEQTEC